MKQINFAIVGFGSIAKTHALAVYDANLRYDVPFKLNLTHVVTRRPIEIPLPGVKNLIDLDEVLGDPEIHFIDICTPNDSHHDIVKRAVEHGKAIYCEKPLSSTYEEGVEMTRWVQEKELPNAVALMYRFLPSVQMLRKELAVGTIGQVIDFKIKTYHKSYLSEKKLGVWRTKKSAGGGALLDLGVHLLDLIQFTMGEIAEVNAKTRIHFTERTEVDEIANCDFVLDNGVRGNLEVSRIFAERKQTDELVVFGTQGSIKIDLTNPYEMEIYQFENSSTVIKNAAAEAGLLNYYAGQRASLGFFQNCHTASLIHFAECVAGRSEEQMGADFAAALRCQKILEDVYKESR